MSGMENTAFFSLCVVLELSENEYIDVEGRNKTDGSGKNRQLLKGASQRKRAHTGATGRKDECFRQNGITLGDRKQYAGFGYSD